MKLNFTIELPCKDHDNCYNLEMEGDNQVEYVAQGQPQTQNGVTTVNFGNKITITEKLTRKIIKEEELDKITPEQLDQIDKEHNDLIYKYNRIVDKNQQIKDLNTDLKQKLKDTHPDPKDSHDYKLLLQDYNSIKEINELKLKNLNEKVQENDLQGGLDETLRKQKFKDLEREVNNKNGDVDDLKKIIDEMKEKMKELEKEREEMEGILDQKYEHFEEMNKYINDLLMEKKQLLGRKEQDDRQMKEMQIDIQKFIEVQESGSDYPNNPDQIKDRLIRKYKIIKKTTTTKKIRKINGEYIEVEVPAQSGGIPSQGDREYKESGRRNISDEELDDAYKKIKQLKDENDKLIDQNEKLKNNGNNDNIPQDEFDKLQQENDKLKKNNNDNYNNNIPQDEYNKLQQENDRLKKNNNNNNDNDNNNIPQDEYDKLKQENEYLQSNKNNNVPQTDYDKLKDENKQLRHDNRAMKEKVNKYKQKIITITKEIETQKTNTITKTDELKTHETKIIKLKPKDKIKKWKEVKENMQKMMKNFKKAIEDAQGEPFYDNLDLNVEKESATEYKSLIDNFIRKGDSYINQIKLLLEDKQNMENELKELKKQLREGNNSTDLDQIKEIFDKTGKTTDHFVDLIKIAKKDQFINHKKYKIDSEEPELYLEGIDYYFKTHKNFYQTLKTILEDKNAQLRKLEQFKQDIISGKNKDYMLDDMKNVYNKNHSAHQKLNQLQELMGDEVKEHPKEEFEESDDVINAVNEQFFRNNKQMQNLKRSIEDMKEDYEQKLKNKKPEKEVDVNQMKKLLNNINDNNKQSQNIILQQDPNTSQVFSINITETDEPMQLVEQMEKKTQSMAADLSKIDHLLKEKDNEIERLEEYEKQVKSGQQLNQQTSDLNYLLKRNKTLFIQSKDTLDEIQKTKSDDKEFKLKGEKPDDYIDTIKEVIQQTSDNILQMAQENSKNNEKQQKLDNILKQQKESAQNSRQAIWQPQQKNQEDLFNLLKKIDNKDGEFKSEKLKQNPEEADIQIKKELGKENDNIRAVEDVLEKQKRKIEQLEEFKQDVESGKLKDFCIGDFRDQLQQCKKSNEDLVQIQNNLTGENTSSYPVYVNDEDVESLQKAIQDLNKQNNEKLEELKNQSKTKQDEINKLKKFQKDVQNGINKENEIEDLNRILNEQKKGLKAQEEVIAPYKDQFATIVPVKEYDKDDANDLLRGIDDGNKEFKQNAKRFKNALKDLGDKNNDLEQYKKDIESGQNKDFALNDYKKLFENSKQENFNLVKTKENLTGSPERQKSFYVNDKDVNSLLEQLNTMNEMNNNLIKEINEEIEKKNKSIKDFEDFKKDILSGKNKENCKKDFQNIHGDQNQMMKDLEKYLKDNNLDYKSRQKSDPVTVDNMIDRIRENNEYLKDYIKKLKQRINDFHDQLQKQVKVNHEQKQKLDEVTVKNESLEMKNDRQLKKIEELEKLIAMLKSEQKESVKITQFKNLEEISIDNQKRIDDIARQLGQKIDPKNKQTPTDIKSVIKVLVGDQEYQKLQLEQIKQALEQQKLLNHNNLRSIKEALDIYLKSYAFSHSELIDEEFVYLDISIDHQNEIPGYCIKYLEYLNKIDDNIVDDVNNQRDILQKAKQEILHLKEKLQLQVEDLNDEINQKTTLIGKLQVKVYMLISIMDHRENMPQ